MQIPLAFLEEELIPPLGLTFQQYFDTATLFQSLNGTKEFHCHFQMDHLGASHDTALPEGKIQVASSNLCRLGRLNEGGERIKHKM